MLAHILGWISGYVIIHIYGENKERLLNIALQRGIEIYDINWLGEEIVEAKVNYRQIGLLRKIAKKTKCNFKTKHKTGLPFWYKYFGQRRGFAVGVIAFILGIFVLSMFTMGVTVTEREEIVTLDLAEVKAEAAKLGVHPGAYISSLDFEAIEKQLRKEIPELSWVNIERHGTLLNIMVAERNIYPEEESKATIGAIWAEKDALVEEVLIKHGQAMVAPGDTVQKGQLLVSPLADGRADAIIRARVWYEGYGEGALREGITHSATNTKKSFYLLSPNGENRLQLWGKAQHDSSKLESKLILEQENYQLQLGSQKQLPIAIVEESYKNQMLLFRDNTEEEAKADALEQAKSSLQQQAAINHKLLNETADYKFLSDSNVWSAKVKWECLEEIGIRNRTEE